QVLAVMGPAAIPAFVRHLDDPHEHVRAIAVATLGHLHAQDTVPLIVEHSQDPSDFVRQSLVEALGLIGSAVTQNGKKRRPRRPARWRQRSWSWRRFAWKPAPMPQPPQDPTELAVTTLQAALTDASVLVRTQAAQALGHIGFAATPAAPGLIALFK